MCVSGVYSCSAANGKQTTILSDGAVVCSCYDKTKDNSLGSLYQEELVEIWNGEKYSGLLDSVSNGYFPTRYCNRCHFLKDGRLTAPRQNGPAKLIIEYNCDCILKCPGCERDAIITSRNEKKMAPYLVDKIIGELPGLVCLEKIGFFNHGEPLLYDEAFGFLKSIKQAVPKVTVFTSTNGLTIDTENRLAALIESGIDTVLFSIDGVDEESYRKYRIGGSFEKAFNNMKRLIRMKRRLGLSKPDIIWRYIIFKWNDHDHYLTKAMALAADLGVTLCFLPTDYPVWGVSKQYSNGGTGTIIEPYLRNVF